MTNFLPFDIAIINNNSSNKDIVDSDYIKFLWLTASWKNLVLYSYEVISKQDKYGWIAVLFAVAYQECGNITEADRLINIAKSKKIEPRRNKSHSIFKYVEHGGARSSVKGR